MQVYEFIKKKYKDLEEQLASVLPSTFVIQGVIKKEDDNFQFTCTLSVYDKRKINTDDEIGVVISTDVRNASHYDLNPITGANKLLFLISDVSWIRGENNEDIIVMDEISYPSANRQLTEEQTLIIEQFIKEGKAKAMDFMNSIS